MRRRRQSRRGAPRSRRARAAGDAGVRRGSIIWTVDAVASRDGLSRRVPNAAARYPTTADLSPETSPESAYLSTTAYRAPSCRAARITATVGPPPQACSGRTSSARCRPSASKRATWSMTTASSARRGVRIVIVREIGAGDEQRAPARAGRSPSASPSARAVAGGLLAHHERHDLRAGRHAPEERQLHLERVLARVRGRVVADDRRRPAINDSVHIARRSRATPSGVSKPAPRIRRHAVEADEVRRARPGRRRRTAGRAAGGRHARRPGPSTSARHAARSSATSRRRRRRVAGRARCRSTAARSARRIRDTSCRRPLPCERSS